MRKKKKEKKRNEIFDKYLFAHPFMIYFASRKKCLVTVRGMSNEQTGKSLNIEVMK